jgi:hypothetical protein
MSVFPPLDVDAPGVKAADLAAALRDALRIADLGLISARAANLLAVSETGEFGRASTIAAQEALDIRSYDFVANRSLKSVVAKVVSKSANQKIAFLGDSTNAAVGGGDGGSNINGARANAPVAVARRLLQARGIECRSDAFFGGAGIATPANIADYALYNPNVLMGAGWGFEVGNYVGGSFFYNQTNTNALTFTPEKNADRFDIQYVTGAGMATITVTDASGTLATINANAASGIAKTTVTRPVANTSPISIQRNGTGSVFYLGGVDPWNSTLKELRLLNLAVSGWRGGNYYDTILPFSSRYGLVSIAADYTYIEFGLNEKALGGTIANDINNNLRLLAQSQAPYGGVAIGLSAPAAVADAHNLTLDWRSAIKALANDNGYAFVNHYAPFISYEASPGDYYDTVHPTKIGYVTKGRTIADWIMG